MTFDDRNDPLEALKSELAAVGPSPAFAAGVRGRIDAAGERSSSVFPFAGRWVVSIGVAAAAVVWTLVVQQQPAPPQAVVATADAVPAPVVPAEPGVTAAAPSVVPAATAPAGVEPGVRSASANEPLRVPRRPATQMTAATNALRQAEPTLEVITNQPAVLRALWKNVTADATVVGPPASPFIEPGADIVVLPVEVSPVVVKWMVEPPAGAGGEGGAPIIRRMAASTAARSDQ